MAKRRQSRRRPDHRGGRYAPPARVTRAPLTRIQVRPVLNLHLRTRRSRLDHPVSEFRTVRLPLIRTVLRDTKSRKLNNWRSPDLHARTLLRLRSIHPYQVDLARSWPAFAPAALSRASNCARRSIRREVLFALRQTNGAGSRGRPKSKEKC